MQGVTSNTKQLETTNRQHAFDSTAPPIHDACCAVVSGIYSGTLVATGVIDGGSSCRSSRHSFCAMPGTALPPPHTNTESNAACTQVESASRRCIQEVHLYTATT